MSTRPFTACVVGSGGREHALASWLARSVPVVVSPGNPGMPARRGAAPGDDGGRAVGGGGGEGISVTSRPPEEVDADLVVIGPEAPLTGGLADRLRAEGRAVVGPGADGARLEGSKAFMKRLLAEAGVPTARFGVFDEVEPALGFLRSLPGPWVIKTDGLAAGKGVTVADDLGEAEADLRAKLSGESFGDAGRTVVIEEGLEGPECSLLVLCDGRRVVPLELAQDAKRLADGDEGPNTGGMGAYSPLPWAESRLTDRLMEEAVEPLVHRLRSLGVEYRGVLYAGVMLTPDGPRVLEYNVRFGDPEAQAVLPRLEADAAEVLSAVAAGRLTGAVADRVRFRPDAAVCVVMAAPGYPSEVRAGDEIEGLSPDGQPPARRPVRDPMERGPAVTVFHAATARQGDRFRTAGGRVLGVTAVGGDLPAAREAAYEAVAGIGWDGVQYRTDIAASAGGAG